MPGSSGPDGPKSEETGQVWAALVPELTCLDLPRSLSFWRDVLGFRVRYDRPGFAYLELERCEVMLEQTGSSWQTAPLGRGINFQMEVTDVQRVLDSVTAAGVPLFRPLPTRWYRVDDIEYGQSEFLVKDPDGYLLRFMQHLGQRPAKED